MLFNQALSGNPNESQMLLEKHLFYILPHYLILFNEKKQYFCMVFGAVISHSSFLTSRAVDVQKFFSAVQNTAP